MINPSGSSQNYADVKTQIPDITDYFTEVVACILMTPKKGDPRDDERVLREVQASVSAEEWQEIYSWYSGKSTGKVRRRVPCQWGLPSVIWGLSGIGKSERIEAVAEGLKLPFVEVFPSQHAPEDFAGSKMPNGQGKLITVCTLPGIEGLLQTEEGIVFLDEASGAVPSVQSAMLEFVNRGRIGDIKLPLGVRRILAANPPEYAASGWALEAPMANRLAHFKMRPPENENWASHMLYEELEEKIDLQACKAALVKNWAGAWSHTLGAGANFVRRRDQQTLHAQPLPSSPHAGYAWVSPRSWESGLRGMATARALNFPVIVGEMMFEACVGQGVASEFLNWLRNADLPSPQKVLLEGWAVDTDRLDITHAVIDSVTSYVISLRDIEERILMGEKAYQFLYQVTRAGQADLIINSVRLLINHGIKRDSPHATSGLRKAIEPVLQTLQQQKLLTLIPQDNH